MLELIGAHLPEVQIVLQAMTVVVWVAYFQLLLANLRRQRRPALLINTGAGSGVRQACFVSNLGMEPIYLMDVAIRVEAGDRVEVAAITDRPDTPAEGPSNLDLATNQGPLDSGAMRTIGTFETLIERAVGQCDLRAEDVTRLELVAIFAMAAENRIGAAKRAFIVDGGGQAALYPATTQAEQITGRRARHALNRWLEARRQGRDRESDLP